MNAASERFFVMAPQFGRSGLGLANKEILSESSGAPRAGTIQIEGRLPRGLPELPVPPVLTFDRNDGPPPDDIEVLGQWWVVSESFKIFAESVDPDAFQFGACDNSRLLIDGARPTYWLCAVKRIGSFINEEKSEGLIVKTDWGLKQFVVFPSRTKLAVDREKLGTGHVFSAPETFEVFCDGYFRTQFKAAGLRLRSFENV